MSKPVRSFGIGQRHELYFPFLEPTVRGSICRGKWRHRVADEGTTFRTNRPDFQRLWPWICVRFVCAGIGDRAHVLLLATIR